MPVLLEMEPRVVGTGVMEPVVEFENPWESRSDRAECLLTKLGVSQIC
jgi:hypothetical protein